MRWLARFWHRKQLEQQLDTELLLHIDLLAKDLEAQGLAPDEARRQALMQFGRPAQLKEDCRDARGTLGAEGFLQDARYAIRRLQNSPGVSIVAIAALALGIGANTAMFSAVYALLLQPLPYPDPDRLFMLFQQIPAENRIMFSTREFELWRAGTQAFSALGVWTGNGFTLTGRGEPLAQTGVLATPSLFDLLGVPAARGRTFRPEEAKAGHDHVVLLSDGLWRERFNADPSVVGQPVTLNGESYIIVGVMPPGFAFPSPRYQLWVPAALDGGIFQKFPGAHFLRVIGRLRPDGSAGQLDAEVAVLGKRVSELDPQAGRRVYTIPLAEVARGEVRHALLLMLGAVGLVLLIACANLASLLLARATARQRELAVRVSLGAGRRRLMQQLLVESLLLAMLGGVAGLAFAEGGLRLLRTLGTTSLPGIEAAHLNLPVLTFSMGLSITTGLLFGLLPALLASRRALQDGLREGARGTTQRSTRGAQGLLVFAEVALSVVLLAGAGLLLHSFWKLSATSPGFRADHVLTASVSLNDQAYPDAQDLLNWYTRTLARVRELPGVDSTALATHLPFSGQGWGNGYEVEGRPAPPGKGYVAQIRPVSPDYFASLAIPLRTGDGFTDRDRAGTLPVAIVNETLARRFWPEENPVGRRIRFDQAWLTIRGVVGDIKHQRLDAASDAEIYVPYPQLPPNLMRFLGRGLTVIVHGPLPTVSLAVELRTALHEVDPNLAVREVRPMESLVTDSVAQPRLRAGLVGCFAVAALLLAALGIYGVMSYLVAQRTKEMGVRLALGAQPGSLVRLVVGRALAVTGAGVIAGLGGALLLSRLLEGLLFGIGAYDPLAFAAAPVLLLVVAVLASLWPARRAARVDPVLSLRAE